jgi:hypothetical protein
MKANCVLLSLQKRKCSSWIHLTIHWEKYSVEKNSKWLHVLSKYFHIWSNKSWTNQTMRDANVFSFFLFFEGTQPLRCCFGRSLRVAYLWQCQTRTNCNSAWNVGENYHHQFCK